MVQFFDFDLIFMAQYMNFICLCVCILLNNKNFVQEIF